MPPSTIAVVLAAGAGRRFRASADATSDVTSDVTSDATPGHKLLAPLHGRPVVAHAVAAAAAAAIGPVLVVTGAAELPADVAALEGVRVVHHPGWADGQATSLAVAVAEAERLGAAAVVVGLGDQPFVTPAAWRAVAASTSPIAVATYDGRRGNPVRLAREVWPLLPVSGDEGARSLLRLRPDLVEQVPCPGSPDDIDTVSDLQRAEES